MKKYSLIALALLVIIVGAFVAVRYSTPMQEPTVQTLATKTITVGSTPITVEVADTDAAREQGLSGRTSLAEGQGMLFVFQQDGDWGFWMKDMNFPIDIVFISETQDPNVASVVSVVPNASSDSYHQNPPQIFYPPLAVKYVLELPAGDAARLGIVQDTQVKL